MITAHESDHLTLWDGKVTHTIAHKDFYWYEPTQVHDGYLMFPPGHYDFSHCLVQPITVTHPNPFEAHEDISYAVIPIKAYLRASYGPDGHLVTVPINGDAAAQLLHWRLRDEQGRAEMRSVLESLNAWRLTDDGELPDASGESISAATAS